MIVNAQTSATMTIKNAVDWVELPGLTVQVPEGVGEQALLILNVPNPYATGNANPGGNFGLKVNGEVQSAFASFTYCEVNPSSSGRVPTTLVITVPLSESGGLTVTAVCSSVRGSTVVIDSPATLTAFF
jgi:mannose-binding lectin